MQFGRMTIRVNWLEGLKRHATLCLLLTAATVVVLVAILWFGRMRISGAEAMLFAPGPWLPAGWR